MAQYAQFDSTATGPTPVSGWYDTDIFEYPNLPSASNLVEATAVQWALHFAKPQGWTVDNGQLVEPESA